MRFRIFPSFLLSALLLFPLFVWSATEIDVRSVKVTEQKDPPVVNFQFRLTGPDEVSGVEANVDGHKLQAQFTPFLQQADTSAAFLFVIDNSDPKRAKTIAASKALVQKLIDQAGPKCKFAVYTLAADLVPVVEFGTPLEDVPDRLKSVKASGMATELYRNCIAAMKVLDQTGATRKALVLLSDGRAEDTSFDVNQTLDQAAQSGVVIFGIGYAERPQWTVYLQSMRRMAEGTGGMFGEADIGTKKVPEELTGRLYDLMASGGAAKVDLSGLASGDTVNFVVNTKSGSALNYSYKLAAITLAPPPTPTPAPSVEPVSSPAPAVTSVATATPIPTPTAVPKEKAYLQKQPALPPAKKSIAGRIAQFVLISLFLILLALVVTRVRRRATVPSPAPFEPGHKPAAPARVIYARLEFFDPAQTEYLMHTTAVRIGRGKDNDLVVQNDSISRHHAEIHRRGDGTFTITDLAAGNGVIVNGVKLEQATLKNEDVVELGEVRLRFVTV